MPNTHPPIGVSSALTDAESGQAAQDARRDLHALQIMRQRGLISPDLYEERHAKLIAKLEKF